MVFRRRTKRTAWEWVKASVYPQGGWLRAVRYILHRLTRLPDPPHRIARGIFVGAFVSFTPLFGVHILVAALLAYLVRGNIFAAILGTLVGNPITFPVIAVLSVQLGHMILGTGVDGVPAAQILTAFASAGAEIGSNFVALMMGGDIRWTNMRTFYVGLFKPYLIGGLVPGLVVATLCYHLSLPVITAYHRLRQKRRQDRAARRQGSVTQGHPVATPPDNKDGTA
ncbi:MAG: DUF2062 domain-containing protein [Rhodobacteraceae bacterium]|nr:DUF2062 domain-containing protein [Paracoccaceae bacterium]